MPELRGMEILSMSEIADLLEPPEPRDQTRYHVSSLVNEAARVTGNTFYVDKAPEQWRENIMAMGRILEYDLRVICHQRAGEKGLIFEPQIILTLDDVLGTLDGILYDAADPTQAIAVVEMKTAWSQPRNPLENWRYMCQVQAYCKLARCTEARMPVVNLPRSHGPPNVEARLYTISFEQGEINENWNLLLNVRDTLIKLKLEEN